MEIEELKIGKSDSLYGTLFQENDLNVKKLVNVFRKFSL